MPAGVGRWAFHENFGGLGALRGLRFRAQGFEISISGLRLKVEVGIDPKP